MRSVAPITKILPQFLWSAKMPKIYAKCQKSMQKTWNFIFCHLNLVRAVYYLSFKLLVRSVAPLTKILPPFLWFGGVYVTNIEGFAMVLNCWGLFISVMIYLKFKISRQILYYPSFQLLLIRWKHNALISQNLLIYSTLFYKTTKSVSFVKKKLAKVKLKSLI